MGLYVQYGCGIMAPADWVNFDSSPTLQLQRIPLLGLFTKKKVVFPPNVKYGDIVKGLPGITDGSCDAVYCSHVLEHLSMKDFYKALENTYKVLKKGGIFRCVLPDLEWSINRYIEQKKANNWYASIEFMQSTMLGLEERPVSIKDRLIYAWGNSGHLWMWDEASLKQSLERYGYSSIRPCIFNDSKEEAFKLVEQESRFVSFIAFECVK